jgi:hypothetical protein
MLNRRTFLKASLQTSAAALTLDPTLKLAAAPPQSTTEPTANLIALPARLAPLNPAAIPWQQKIRRVGQSNMTEHDPAVMNIEEWADYWHSAGADLVFVSVTGILAFYPSKVPFHRHGQFLNNRDFFGECVAAAKKRNMRVVARMSPDLNWPDALDAHPEWAMRNKDGSPQLNTEDSRLFKTCMFSSYMDDYIPAIMREVNSLYDIDCFYTNGWPPLGSLPECHCAICSKLPPPTTTAYWRAFNDRLFELWEKYDAIAKEKKPDSFFFANLGGNVHAGPNLVRLAKIASWFQGDNQGRTNDDPAIWGGTLQGRVVNAVNDGHFAAANITASYSTGVVRWRNASKNPAEARMWTNETLASGLIPYFHFIGSEDGFCEDRRWQKVAADYLQWTARHDPHLKPRRSIANIGVVIGQSTQLLYKGPAVANSHTYMRETTHGIYEALLHGRFTFDLVHEERLTPELLSRYRLLILPNIAMLSDQQCQQLRDFANSGGSLMASFETGLYDEDLKPRSDFALAELLGISKAGEVVGTNGNAYYARIEKPAHVILNGFTDTNWLPGAQNRIPLKPVADPILTVVPGFVQYPPELAYPQPPSRTNEPAVVLRESAGSRTAYFPGDIERTYWLTGHADLLALLHNTIRWLTHDEVPIQIQGEGFIESFAWETNPGYAIHLLNYTNPNAHHCWMQATYPLGSQTITLKLPPNIKPKSVALLRAEHTIPFTHESQTLRFIIPRIDDYEIAAITII